MERGRVRGTETDSKKQKERDGQKGDTEQRRDGGRIERERDRGRDRGETDGKIQGVEETEGKIQMRRTGNGRDRGGETEREKQRKRDRGRQSEREIW